MSASIPGASAPRRSASELDAWQALEAPAIRLLPYALLVFCTVITQFVPDSIHGSRPAVHVLTGVVAAWMLWMLTLHPSWSSRPRAMAVYFVGLWLLCAALVVQAPLFGFFGFTGYLHTAFLRGNWRFVGVVSVAVVEGTAQTGGLPRWDTGGVALYLTIVGVNIGIAIGVSWFAWIGEERDALRRQTMEELVETNRRLEASLEENARLQARLLEQAREAGVVDERQRMARELHDTLAQGLTGIITQLQAAEQADPASAGWRRHLDAAAGLARESLTEARRSVHALRPEALEVARLPEALADVTARWAERTGVAARVVTTGSARPMRPEIEVTLLRTAQEALANVAKHARASRVGLTLSYMEDQVTLDVRDDGVGFDPAALAAAATSGVTGVTGANGTNGTNGAGGTGSGGAGPDADGSVRTGGGFGLTAMRQRVHGLAGTLAVESEPGGGTAVSASVPAILASGAP